MKTVTLSIAGIVTAISFQSAALAQDVQDHRPWSAESEISTALRAADGTEIHIRALSGIENDTYQETTSLRDIEIQVSKVIQNQNMLSPDASVRAVFQVICRHAQSGAELQRTVREVDLASTGSYPLYFHATLPESFRTGFRPIRGEAIRFGAPIACSEEISVVVNGQWLVDPVNGTHNFQVRL